MPGDRVRSTWIRCRIGISASSSSAVGSESEFRSGGTPQPYKQLDQVACVCRGGHVLDGRPAPPRWRVSSGGVRPSEAQQAQSAEEPVGIPGQVSGPDPLV
ncbi:hypothetical protein ACFFX0_27770 [Citricoccus parietis]|uniref:Uncharacterized protein n=1 Tax=Citricoccus parietis TaxID=592307 RepID=A0ABV5G760_9MICC